MDLSRGRSFYSALRTTHCNCSFKAVNNKVIDQVFVSVWDHFT